MRKEKFNIDSTIEKQLVGINEILQGNMVIGNTIKINENVSIIPVSKITIGFLNGGGEYGDIKLFTKEKTHPLIGGGGAIVNMNPNGFLTIINDNIKYVKTDENIVEGVFEKTAEFIEKNINAKV